MGILLAKAPKLDCSSRIALLQYGNVAHDIKSTVPFTQQLFFKYSCGNASSKVLLKYGNSKSIVLLYCVCSRMKSA
eukprot:g83302.t1